MSLTLELAVPPVHYPQGRSPSLPWASHYSQVTLSSTWRGRSVPFLALVTPCHVGTHMVLFVFQNPINPLWKGPSGICCLPRLQPQMSTMSPWGHFGEHLRDRAMLPSRKIFSHNPPWAPLILFLPRLSCQQTLEVPLSSFHRYMSIAGLLSHSLDPSRDPCFTYYQTQTHTPHAHSLSFLS